MCDSRTSEDVLLVTRDVGDRIVAELAVEAERRGARRFRALLDDLYRQWQKDLVDSGTHVRVLPDERPAPEIFLRS